MPVPTSVAIKADASDFKPHHIFSRNKPFDNFHNIKTVIKGGGFVRGVWADGLAGPFEIFTKKESEGYRPNSSPGLGRWVPSRVIESMIHMKEIFVVQDEENAGLVSVHLTEDEVFSDGFPDDWGVRHVPSTDATYLFKPGEERELSICERPRGFLLEEWVPLARTMAIGLAMFPEVRIFSPKDLQHEAISPL
jgi:hypothetical protein